MSRRHVVKNRAAFVRALREKKHGDIEIETLRCAFGYISTTDHGLVARCCANGAACVVLPQIRVELNSLRPQKSEMAHAFGITEGQAVHQFSRTMELNDGSGSTASPDWNDIADRLEKFWQQCDAYNRYHRVKL